jgi:hypothetical protein
MHNKKLFLKTSKIIFITIFLLGCILPSILSAHDCPKKNCRRETCIKKLEEENIRLKKKILELKGIIKELRYRIKYLESERKGKGEVAQKEKGITINVSLEAPDTAWSIKIKEVYLVDKEIWVISKLKRSPKIAAQVITKVKDSLNLQAPNLPIKHFILGKTWRWKNKESYTFIKNKKEILNKIKNARKLFPE